MSEEFKIDDTVDVTDVKCPTTFVKAKVAIEELDEGQILAIRLNDGEPVQTYRAASRKKATKSSSSTTIRTEPLHSL